MKLINFTLLKKIVLLCILLFVLNMILNIVTKREGFYIVSTVDSEANALSKKLGPSTLEHSSDLSGKSSYTDIYLKLDNGYEVVIACYDWSEEALKKENKHDHMYISIRSLELDAWLN